MTMDHTLNSAISLDHHQPTQTHTKKTLTQCLRPDPQHSNPPPHPSLPFIILLLSPPLLHFTVEERGAGEVLPSRNFELEFGLRGGSTQFRLRRGWIHGRDDMWFHRGMFRLQVGGRRRGGACIQFRSSIQLGRPPPPSTSRPPFHLHFPAPC